VGKLRSQRRAQRAQQFLLRKGVVIGSRLRPMHGAAVAPQRRTDRADTRPPRALLLPQLLARSGNAPAVLGGMRARARGGAIVCDRLPGQVFVDRAENFFGQIHRPSLGSAQIVNINGCHILSRVGRTLLAAFNGSTVAEPANPRRSRGGFFALLIMMYPPFGPGTLPSTTSRFSSFS